MALKEPVCWWCDKDADLEMDRVIADARSEHYGHHSHIGINWVKRLVNFTTALLTCSCGSSSQMDFQLISRVRLRLKSVYGTFPARRPRCDRPASSHLESFGATRSSQWTISASSTWRSYAEKWRLSWLKQLDFVIFRYISTKHGGKMYILLFKSCKILCKNLLALLKYRQKSRGLLFVTFVFTR